MTLKLKIFSIGRPKEQWIEEGVKEYSFRLKSFLKVDFVWLKDYRKLFSFLEKESRVICLDPSGKLMDSQRFSEEIFQHFQIGGARLAFVIGGAEGLPESFKSRYPLISLSPLTFTHQMTRLILIEQIYRAFEISRGSSYHK